MLYRISELKLEHEMRAKLKICFMGWGDSIHMQRWMQWFVQSGHEVHLITDHPSNMNEIIEHDISSKNSFAGGRLERFFRFEFNVYRLRALTKILRIDLLKQILKTREIVRTVRPDIVHLHTLLFPAYLGVFCNFRPLVVTPWNGDIIWRADWSFLRKLAVTMGIKKANLITVDSEELRGKTLLYGPYENKIEYVSFGVDTKIFHPTARCGVLRRQLNISPDAPVVLSCRSMEDLYNIDIIIKAIPEVLKDFPSAVFLFAWHSASKRSALMELAQNLGITSSIKLIGRIEHTDLPEYYAESDIFVSVPTGDTIAISLLEAMASGVAPVVSDLPSTRECIKDGINGYIVPVRDVAATAKSIKNLLSDDGLRKSFAVINRQWVFQNADWDVSMKKVEESYYRLAMRGRQ